MTAPGGGRIGMVACPGLRRGLEADLEGLKQWGANGLVSLVETHELVTLGITNLEAIVERHGLWWRHLPIKDRRIPDEGFETRWRSEGARLRRLLSGGDRIVVHCWAGLGRTGTIAARLLIEMGCEPADAIRRVREARPGTIETDKQELFLQTSTLLSARDSRG